MLPAEAICPAPPQALLAFLCQGLASATVTLISVTGSRAGFSMICTMGYLSIK